MLSCIDCKFKDLKMGISLSKYNTELWNLTYKAYLWYVIYLLSFKQIPVLVSQIFKYMLTFFKNIFLVKFDLQVWSWP